MKPSAATTLAQQGDAVALGDNRGGERGDGEGDGEIAAIERHDERQGDGRGDAGGKGAAGEPGRVAFSGASGRLPKRWAAR